jgi:hypothetical protein
MMENGADRTGGAVVADQGTGGQGGFVDVIVRQRSHLDILYLLLGLPLGTVHLNVPVTGSSLGIGLTVVALVSILILIWSSCVTHAFRYLQHALAIGTIGVDVPPVDPLPPCTELPAPTVNRMAA